MTQTNKAPKFTKGDQVCVIEGGYNELHCILMENFDKYGYAMAKGHSYTFQSKTELFMVHMNDLISKLKYDYVTIK